ncbi:MAG: hypothetical protein SFU91_08700 [Chloroherpetonaceae bacterium]|nr:hypothetical protein [Chloroherpetonaceae bacterium]
MKKKLLLCIAIVTFIPQVILGQTSYPKWFLYPGKYPEFHNGYTFGKSDASVDAERTYCVFKKCILDGTLTVFLREDGYPDLRDSDYHYYFDQEELDAITGKMIFQDGFVTNVLRREIIGIYSLDQISLPDEAKEVVSLQTLPMPEWVQRDVWEDGGYIYGVGRFQTSGNLNDAWKTTEERAIFGILNFTGVKFFVSRFQEETGRSEEVNQQVQAYKLRFRVNDIEIVERWLNLETQSSFVLARIKRVNILTPATAPKAQTKQLPKQNTAPGKPASTGNFQETARQETSEKKESKSTLPEADTTKKKSVKPTAKKSTKKIQPK